MAGHERTVYSEDKATILGSCLNSYIQSSFLSTDVYVCLAMNACS